MKDIQTIVMLELFSTFLIFAFVLLAKRQTQKLALLYNRNNVKPNDYTMYIQFSESQIREFDQKILDKQKRNSSRGI